MRKNTGSGLVLFDGTKSISAWNLDDTRGWVTVGGSDEPRGVDLYFQRVPWLYRGAMDRAENVGSMPFAVKKGATDYDGSSDYQNKLLFLPNPGKLFRQFEQSLVMTGRAYAFKETNRSGYITALKYCCPNSVTEERDPVTGELIGYRRQVGSTSTLWPVAQFVAINIVDYLTEDGAPKSSAALAALTASGVLYNVDRFIADFFRRGAIKATVLTVDGGTQNEAERFQHWWEDVVAGIKNAWAAVVVKMKDIKATVIGEGLESLQNNELTTERRQDIATALGVPESRLWSSAANYATRVEDERAYFKSTIIPECLTIADAFNEQVFTPAHKMEGYKLVFLTDTLEIFQENVNDQATAASAFIDFLVKCPTEQIAVETCIMMGFELTDALLKAITEMFAKKAEDEARLQAQMDAQGQPGDKPGQNEPDSEDEPNPQEMRAALATWRRKALHALDRGEGADVEFATTVIPARVCEGIRYELAVCKTAEEVKAVFEAVRVPDPDAELKRACALLERFTNVPA